MDDELGQLSSMHSFYRMAQETPRLLVDKSLLIRDVIKKANEMYIMRPRRFGKSLNLDMLKAFFDITCDADLVFDGLKIKTQELDLFERYRNKYFVVSLDLAGVCDSSLEATIANIGTQMAGIYRKFAIYLEEFKNSGGKVRSSKIGKLEEKLEMESEKLLNCKDQSLVKNSLKELIYRVAENTGIQFVLLIDEFDAPYVASHKYGFYQPFNEFMNVFLSVIKNNEAIPIPGYRKVCIFKTVFTGIISFPMLSLSHYLNSMVIDDMAKSRFSEHYGFTEDEVNSLMGKVECKQDFETVKQWYNGYQSGGQTVYNPFSIVKFLDEGVFASYWCFSGNHDEMIFANLSKSSPGFQAKFTLLNFEDKITGITRSRFVSLERITEDANLWTLLLNLGYLTISPDSDKSTPKSPSKSGDMKCNLQFPNEEVKMTFKRLFSDYLYKRTDSAATLESMRTHFLNLDYAKYIEEMRQWLTKVNCMTPTQEKFYHGIMTVLTMQYGFIDVTPGVGRGFPDLVVTSQELRKTFIIELKAPKIDSKNSKNPKTRRNTLTRSAKEAVGQITSLEYYIGAQFDKSSSQIVLIGMTFNLYDVAVAWCSSSKENGEWTRLTPVNCHYAGSSLTTPALDSKSKKRKIQLN